jgi:hypothetical protein
MTRKEWNEAPTSTDQAGNEAITFNMHFKIDKAFCSQCAVLGILSFCEMCSYAFLLNGNFNFISQGA